MSDHPSAEKHVTLRPMRLNGERESWVTLLHDFENKVDLVIGAGSKEAVIAAFERIGQCDCDPEKVYAVFWRKAPPDDLRVGEGFAYFRKRCLREAFHDE